MSESSNVNSLLLVCVAGPDAGKRIAVTSKTASVGRSSACEIASDDPEVSERHLTLELKDGKIFFAVAAGCAAKKLRAERKVGIAAPQPRPTRSCK